MRNNLIEQKKDLVIFVPGNIPSLKNSKINGKFFSKTVARWLRTFGIKGYSASRKEVSYFKTIPRQHDLLEILTPLKEYTNYPLLLGMHFVRGTKHSWDFNNATHVLLDLMTAMDIIPDDNVNYILPMPMIVDDKYWSYDVKNPGVYISVL